MAHHAVWHGLPACKGQQQNRGAQKVYKTFPKKENIFNKQNREKTYTHRSYIVMKTKSIPRHIERKQSGSLAKHKCHLQQIKEDDAMALSHFLNELQGAIYNNPDIESVPQDIYFAVNHHKTTAEALGYLYQEINSLGKKQHLKYVNVKQAYEYWLIHLICHQIYMHPYDARYDAKGITGLLIKEINAHADKYHIEAYLRQLRTLWLRGGLGSEFKGYVKETLQEHGKPLDLDAYGTKKVK